MPLFAEVPVEAMRQLVLDAVLVDLPKGKELISVGQRSDALYAIIEGEVSVEVPNLEEPLNVGEGGVVGESCLLDGVARRANVRVVEDLRALKIPKTVLNALVVKHPSMGDVLLELLSRRLIANLMNSSPVFKAFDNVGRQQLAALFEVRRADEGTVLVQQGKRMDGLYIPLLGTLDAGGQRVPLGDVLGHASLISYQPSEHTVRATTDVLLLRLSLMRFTELASMFPSVLEYLSNLSPSEI